MVRMRGTGGRGAAKRAEGIVRDGGRTIYAYCNVQTNQVLYSRYRTLDSYQVLKQLPDLGANLKPTKIRKDLWKPLWTLSIPPAPNAHQQSLLAFRKLREWRKLHETNWTPPPELARLHTKEEIEKIQKRLDERGGSKKESPYDLIKQRKRLMRKRVVMDQKANSVADLAAVLKELDETGMQREAEQTKMLDEQRNAEVAEMLKLSSQAHRGGMEALERMLAQLEPVLQRSDEEILVMKDQGKDVSSKRQAKRQAYKLRKKKLRMEFVVEAMKEVKERIDRIELGAEMTREEANTWLYESRQRIRELESSNEVQRRPELQTLKSMTDIVAEGRALGKENEGQQKVARRIEEIRASMDGEKDSAGRREKEMNFQSWRIALAAVSGLPAGAKSRKQILDEQEATLTERGKTLEAKWQALEEARTAMLETPMPKLERRKQKLSDHIAIMNKNIADLVRARDERKKQGMDERIKGLEAKKNEVLPRLRGVENAMSLFGEEGGFEKLQRAAKELNRRLDKIEPDAKSEEAEQLRHEREGVQLVITALMARAHSQGKSEVLKESREALKEADALHNAEEPTQYYREHLEVPLPKSWRLDWHDLLPSFPRVEGKENLPKRGIERQRYKRLHAPVFSLEGVKIKWANMLDAEYAEEWPSNVAIEPMGWSRHTAPGARTPEISDVATWKAKRGANFKVNPVKEQERKAVLEQIKSEVMAKMQEKKSQNALQKVKRETIVPTLGEQREEAVAT